MSIKQKILVFLVVLSFFSCSYFMEEAIGRNEYKTVWVTTKPKLKLQTKCTPRIVYYDPFYEKCQTDSCIECIDSTDITTHFNR